MNRWKWMKVYKSNQVPYVVYRIVCKQSKTARLCRLCSSEWSEAIDAAPCLLACYSEREDR